MANEIDISPVTQLYLILGSVNALGKPVELFSSIATGTKDFFYEVLCLARARLAFDAQPSPAQPEGSCAA
jgi:hypothetical protein